MPEEIRALIFIFIIVSVPLALFPKFAGTFGLKKEAQTWSIAWIGITVLAFLTYNFWVFIALSAILLHALAKGNNIHKIALFFLLFPAIPTGTINIPGFGMVNFILSVNFQLFLSVVLLLPLAITRRNSNKALKSSELFLFVFFLLNLVTLYQETSFIHQGQVVVRESSITSVMRAGVSLFLGFLVPYLAVSKTVKNTNDIKLIFMAFVFGTLLQACIAAAETIKGWHLYLILKSTLNISGGVTYLSREDMLRASGSFSHPITLGLVLAVGIGVLLYFSNPQTKKAKQLFWALLAVFILGLATSLSRGPWVGAVVIALAFLYTGEHFVKRIGKLALSGVFALLILSFFPVGQKIIGLIPFLNIASESRATGTISYRERLMEQSIIVIKKNPIFGSVDYLRDPDMEEIRQGEGIIDIVNSYLAVALQYGLFGLSVFLAIFIFYMIKLKKVINQSRRIPQLRDLWLQGRILFATMAGLLVILFTTGRGITSNYLIWSLLGLGVAYINIFYAELFKIYNMNSHPKENANLPTPELSNPAAPHPQ